MRRLLLHILLFGLTVGSTVLVGGPWYCVSIMTILLAHELGHFFMSRRYHVRSSLPFFIPFPNLFGTLGAVILMRGRIRSRTALFDIGATGPLVGLCLTIPAIVIGLTLSHTVEAATIEGASFRLGDSILFSLIERAVMGHIPEGTDVLLHPLAFAGWVGLFVTALNLMPIGQLDGGHIAYALFGRRHDYIAYSFFLLMWVMGLFFWPGWIFMAFLILILIRVKHPSIIDEEIQLDRKRKLLGGATILIFILTFMPVPIVV